MELILLLPLPEGAAHGGLKQAERLSQAVLDALQPHLRPGLAPPQTDDFELHRTRPGERYNG